MDIGISKLFGIEKEERSIISVLIFQSVFLGIFYGVFNITAHAIFLSRFDETDMAKAYIISGLAGSALTYLYSIFQVRLRFSSFSVLNLIFTLLITLSLWFLIRTSTDTWVIYAVFVMLGPLFILAMLGYWGTAGRLFTLRQGRRLFGLIDTGLILGIIISSFSIPALLSFNLQTHDIILISAFSILIAVFFQLSIIRKHRLKLGKEQRTEKQKAGLAVFRENKYIRSMGVFIALSVLVAFFVQYSFMAVTKIRYPEEADMARFLGFFEGSMMVFTLLIKTFIFSYLIKNHGLKITLAISPVLIGLFTIVAVIIGSSRGYLPGTSGFMIFFLILAISRLFSKALKDSVETPAFKVLYQTLGDKLRHSVQSAIDGTVNEIAALSSGLLLTGLGALVFVKLIHFSWVLTIIIILWVVFAIRLYNEYRGSIKKSLVKSTGEEAGKEESESLVKSPSASGLFIDNNYFELITSSDLHESISTNHVLLNQVINLAESRLNPDILPMLKSLRSKGLNNNGLSERIDSVVSDIEKSMSERDMSSGKDLITNLVDSKDRKLQLQAILSGQTVPVITDLMRLIRDQDDEIVRQTLFIAGKFRIKELLPEICECLDNPEVSKDAYSVLKSFGEEAFQSITGHYYRSSGNIAVRRLLLRLFAETGGKEAESFLLQGIWSINRTIRKEAIDGLIKCEFKADDESRDRLMQEIQDIIGLLTWNLSAQISLIEKEDSTLLETLENDTQWWTEILFDILSLVYDKASLDQIRENLESGTVESVNYALEMIDIVADDEIKPRLTALLDVDSLDDKVKNLFQFYPGNIPEYDELVQDLINKDYNHIGIWTKACAVRSLENIEKPDETDFLVALLFGVQRILREEACRFIRGKYEDIYSTISYRLPSLYRDQLDELLKGSISKEDLLYEKVCSLAEVFPDITRELLLKIADKLNFVSDIKTVPDLANTDYIAWPVNFKEDSESRNILYRWHTAGLESETGTLDKDGPHYILYIKSLEEFIFYESGILPIVARYLDNKLTKDGN